MKIKNIFLLLFFCITSIIISQNENKNTLVYDESVGSPKANLTALSWLSGTWRGVAFGGLSEETWSAPLGGNIVGSFKLVVEGKVQFYELMSITEENQSLIMRLKHFNGDLTGWEEKDDVLSFRLVKVTPNKVFFSGLTFEKISDTEINIYVVIKNDSDEIEEKKFNFKRAN